LYATNNNGNVATDGPDCGYCFEIVLLTLYTYFQKLIARTDVYGELTVLTF